MYSLVSEVSPGVSREAGLSTPQGAPGKPINCSVTVILATMV